MASTQAPLRRGLLFVATHGAYSPRSDAADPDTTIAGLRDCEDAGDYGHGQGRQAGDVLAWSRDAGHEAS